MESCWEAVMEEWEGVWVDVPAQQKPYKSLSAGKEGLQIVIWHKTKVHLLPSNLFYTLISRIMCQWERMSGCGVNL